MPRLLFLLCAILCSVPATGQELDDLLKAVRSRNYDWASRAITRARRAPDGRSVLLAALANRNPYIRIDALQALSATAQGEDKAIDGVREHIAEHRPMQYFGDLPGPLFWVEAVQAMPLAIPTLDFNRKPKKRVPPDLEDPERAARLKALQTLVVLCEGDESRLWRAMDKLEEPHGMHLTRYSDVRLAWVMCFGRGADPREPILDGLASDDPSRQAAAMAAFFRLVDDVEETTNYLFALSDSEHAPIRYRALQLLHRVDPAEEPLRALLERRTKDDVLAVRVVALRRHLQLLNDEPEGAIGLVLEALADHDLDLLALGAECAALLDALDSVRVQPVLKPLIKLLAHKQPQLRRRAAWALGELGPAARKALSALKKHLRDRDETVQEQAKEAIEKIEG